MKMKITYREPPKIDGLINFQDLEPGTVFQWSSGYVGLKTGYRDFTYLIDDKGTPFFAAGKDANRVVKVLGKLVGIELEKIT